MLKNVVGNFQKISTITKSIVRKFQKISEVKKVTSETVRKFIIPVSTGNWGAITNSEIVRKIPNKEIRAV